MKYLTLFITLCSLIGFGGCTSTGETRTNTSTADQAYFTSSFPHRDISPQLSQIQPSIQRVTSTVFYEVYFFEDKNLTADQLQGTNIVELASRKSSIDQSKAGTAISILQNNRHTVLITARHVLTFPDTVIAYKKDNPSSDERYVASIGIKERQKSFLITTFQNFEVSKVAEDRIKDLALIEIPRKKANITPPLQICTGKARLLRLGSFLYVLGFPLGSPTVTRGIVSLPNYDGRQSFLTDALFNPGVSGGLIIASRNNYKSFEWVGMVLTASALDKQFLIPNPSDMEKYEHLEVYTGTPFVSNQKMINYGIANAQPIERIIEFIMQNDNKLSQFGLSFTDFCQK